MLKKLINFITHRLFIVAVILLIQILFLVFIVLKFKTSFYIFYFSTQIIGLLLILKIINSKMNPGYKIAWIIPILIIPIFGTLFYLIFSNKSNKKTNKRLGSLKQKFKNNLNQDLEILQNLKKEDINIYNQMNYLKEICKFPIYDNTKVQYLKIGEIYFEKLIEQLKKAEKYIFLEYFIIEKGYMWDSILEILKEKAQNGVDVRIIYDDMGCILTLPYKYYDKLKEYNIKCCSFNKFIPVLNSKLNCRDHRKIAIIDGKIAFTGGINLADEYINKKERCGHWKDNGIMLEGQAVWTLTVIFLTTWNHINNIADNFNDLKPKYEILETKGYIQPFNDTPLDDEIIGQTVYLNMISKAKKYIYIMTPYLVIDNELETALKNAAKSGLDVRIILPGVPDKKFVNELTKAYYVNLLECNIKIYEYTKGFVHAKTVLVDDELAVVGTINLDYRSLYINFECGVLMYNSECISEVKDDFIETLNECKEITLKDTKIGLFRSLKRSILRLFSPLM